jgi:hypothetical protein
MEGHNLAALGRWPAIAQESVPCAFGDTAHLVIRQIATTQLVCQHFAESSALVPWD